MQTHVVRDNWLPILSNKIPVNEMFTVMIKKLNISVQKLRMIHCVEMTCMTDKKILMMMN